ncbi:MAG TPA: FtsQ-type POTRA domain-containing protein, partial [Roseiflexaceae bacterium]|nr:FtsQ-type POTRA domain-containing protein [Roseiflexaceae bacterium]
MDRFDYSQSSTRERIAARRRRTNVPRHESGVLPGPRRTVGGWFATGRVVSLPLLVACVVALIYISLSPTFRIRDVQVEGTQILEPQAVVDMSGALGRSIWLLDTAQVVDTVQSSAYVETADAALALPDRLTITVHERRPEVRWQQGGQRYLVDGDGRVLGMDPSTTLTNTLVIEDRSSRVLQPNDRIDPDALALARELTLRLPAETHVQVARIAWAPDTGIVVNTPDNRTIIFGRSERIDQKLLIVEQLLR